jgi:hypothetical protein
MGEYQVSTADCKLSLNFITDLQTEIPHFNLIRDDLQNLLE